MSVTSQDLNYLIWRYFQESGLELCAYAMQKETNAHAMDKDLESKVSTGALVRLVQKGIQYIEVESEAWKSISPNAVAPTSLDAYSLLHALTLKPISLEEARPPGLAIGVDKNANGDSTIQDIKSSIKSAKNGQVQVEMVPKVYPLRDLTVSFSTVGSQIARWRPKVSTPTLALGTSESNASILTFLGQGNDSNVTNSEPQTLCLLHADAPKEERDITALSWDPSGSLLVTATFDGKMKIWTVDGKLTHVLSLHRAPVVAIKWNKPGSLIVSVDCTNTVVVWNAFTGDVKQHFQGRGSTDEEVLAMDTSNTNSTPYSLGNDADWVDTFTYACTGDNASIMIYKVGEATPLLDFRGHTQGVNCIEFDETSQLLASGSDDHTIRIWHGKSPVSIVTLAGHQGPVMSVSWIPLDSTELSTLLDPLAPTESNGSLLASGSIDGSIRIWSPTRGICLEILVLHESPIFICQTSPNNKYLASGGVDGVLVVWDISNIRPNPHPSADHAIARYQPEKEECITTISWSNDSNRLFVGYNSTSVIVDL